MPLRRNRLVPPAFFAETALGVMLLAIAVRGLFLAGAYALSAGRLQVAEPDTQTYVRPAESLLNLGSFSSGQTPEITRTPGYPLLLMPGLMLDRLEGVTVILQVILSGIGTAALFSIALNICGNVRVAKWGAILHVVDPLTAIYCGKILTETLFTTLFLCLIWIATRYLRGASLRDLILAGMLTAACAFVRPIASFFPPLLLILLGVHLWTTRQVASPAGKVMHLLLFLAVSWSPIWAWQYRNHRVAEYSGFAAISDINLYFINAAALHGGAPPREWLMNDEGQLAETFSSDGEQLRAYRRAAVHVIRGNWIEFSRLHLLGMLSTLTDPGTKAVSTYFGTSDEIEPKNVANATIWRRARNAILDRPTWLGLHLVMIGVIALQLCCAIRGLVCKMPQHGWLWTRGTFLLLVLGSGLWILSGGPVGGHRFRLPLTPIMALFAATTAIGNRKDDSSK